MTGMSTSWDITCRTGYQRAFNNRAGLEAVICTAIEIQSNRVEDEFWRFSICLLWAGLSDRSLRVQTGSKLYMVAGKVGWERMVLS